MASELYSVTHAIIARVLSPHLVKADTYGA
jgi:hypothetical protein